MVRGSAIRRLVPIIFGITAGLIVGAAAVYLWTHHLRPRSLETKELQPGPNTGRYAGSVSCRECHGRFYELWSPSHHGKAMQPVTADFLAEELTPLDEPIKIGEARFTVDLLNRAVIEEGAEQDKSYPIVHAVGGKNVYFFLTPLDRGRLQVLPISYDVRRRKWFETTGAMVRHFRDDEPADEAIDWRDPMLTFNTACYNCHVSQLDKNYDPATDSYRTTWREPGINCEACHGPGEEHNRICRAVPEGTVPKDLRIVSWRSFTRQQATDACAPCHAKMSPITPSFGPGDRYFDHYDLVCLEDRDFHPDGRDLGENYTMTGWHMNPCVQSGMLDCLHCHTSSGRYRFKEENHNGACLPCHAQRVRHVREHTHHEESAEAPKCISCHMPVTEFGRMLRSDHSFRPPSPEAGIRFGSPVACILCHKDEKPQWAAAKVREWFPNAKWQSRILRGGELVDAARKAEWKKLPDILGYITEDGADPVIVTSLIRLLGPCTEAHKWPAIRQSARHSFPLVRGAAVTALRDDLGDPASVSILFAALADDYRLVRVRAASALARLPRERLSSEQLTRLVSAEKELLDSFRSQPDIWSSHYNLGVHRSDRRQPEAALEAFRRAMVLRPDATPPYLNASVLASRQGRLAEAIGYLRTVHAHAPDDPAVNLNLGLALAGQKDLAGAEKHLRVAFESPLCRAQAAYNLAVIAASRDLAEAIEFAAAAAKAGPGDPQNAYTHAYYLRAAKRHAEAIPVLEGLIAGHPDFSAAWPLLGDVLLAAKRPDDARRHFEAMAENTALPPSLRALARQRLGADGK